MVTYFITEHELKLWGHLKKKVYATSPINVDDLRIRITAEVNILKEKEEDNKDSCFQ